MVQERLQGTSSNILLLHWYRHYAALPSLDRIVFMVTNRPSPCLHNHQRYHETAPCALCNAMQHCRLPCLPCLLSHLSDFGISYSIMIFHLAHVNTSERFHNCPRLLDALLSVKFLTFTRLSFPSAHSTVTNGSGCAVKNYAGPLR